MTNLIPDTADSALEIALNIEFDLVAMLPPEKAQNNPQIFENHLGPFAVDAIVAEVAISEPEFPHGIIDLLREMLIREIVSIGMGPKMKALLRGARFDELLAYLGSKVPDDGVLLIVKCGTECRKFFFGNPKVLFRVSHKAPPRSFDIITNFKGFSAIFRYCIENQIGL
jgi:hypothetical protein